MKSHEGSIGVRRPLLLATGPAGELALQAAVTDASVQDTSTALTGVSTAVCTVLEAAAPYLEEGVRYEEDGCTPQHMGTCFSSQ
jgi:hypothetical protein